MVDIFNLDVLLAEFVLAVGAALLLGNLYAVYKHRRGERPKGAEGEFRTGRVAFLILVGTVMTAWGAVSLLAG